MPTRAGMFALLVALSVCPAAFAQATQPPDDGMPLPPVPPRIATGADYQRCLDMLNNDPQGASNYAKAWSATDGGLGAMHCQALAQIELGNPQIGADLLEQLAGRQDAPALARASIYGQAVQAWMMANRPARAYDAATLALALSPGDASLLIDRAVAAGSIDHYGDAIADLDRVLTIDPRRAEALVLRSVAWRHLDHIDRARDDIDHALMIDPDNAEALLERGIQRQREGDPTGARDDWQRAIQLNPNSTTADLAQQDLALLEAGPKQ